MKLENKFASDLTSKDRNVALAAAKHIINTPDIAAWGCLVNSSDNIFDFIKQNISKYFEQVINENNYKNLFELFKIYSYDWAETLIQTILRFSSSDAELKEKMYNLLKMGTDDEKAYAAKFFSFVHTDEANQLLFEEYSSDFEPLKYNIAQALGNTKDEKSYNCYIDKLNSADDWEKIDAAQFLQWYGNKKAIPDLLKAMDNSAMPEHIAGSIAILDNISKYFDDENTTIKNSSLNCYQYLIDSLAEIWELSTIMDFELADCTEKLIELINKTDISENSRLAALLLKTKYQFETFYNNDEYKFNEDKSTLEAMEIILEMLEEGGTDFWNSCQQALKVELMQENDNRVIYALELIMNLNLKEYVPVIKQMLEKDYPENVIFKLVLTLDYFNDFNNLYKENILAKVSDCNLKTIIEKTMEQNYKN